MFDEQKKKKKELNLNAYSTYIALCSQAHRHAQQAKTHAACMKPHRMLRAHHEQSQNFSIV